MRPFRVGLLLGASALLALAAGVSTRGDAPVAAQTPPPASNNDQPTIPNRYIVTFHDDAAADAYASVLQTSPDVAIGEQYDAAVEGFAARMSPEIAAALDADPAVASIEPDRIVRVDAETLPTGINRIDVEPTGDINAIGPETDVDIAIMDTGIDLDHPDLNVAGGFASYAISFFFFQICGQTDSFDDGHGHGTHVSGTAAARDNNLGVVGVAPGAVVGGAHPGARRERMPVGCHRGRGLGDGKCGDDRRREHEHRVAGQPIVVHGDQQLGRSGRDLRGRLRELRHRRSANHAGELYRRDHDIGCGRLQRLAGRRRFADLHQLRRGRHAGDVQ